MGTLTIRNIDEMTKSRLRVRAARNGRSMEEELRKLIQAATSGEEFGGPREDYDWAERISARFREVGGFDYKPPIMMKGRPPLDFSGPEFGED
jgi:antitoxin FitA